MKARITETIEFTREYFRNPVESMRQLPEWEWSRLLFFYMTMAGACGLVSGIFSRHISQMISGALVFPISSTVGAFLATGFLHYTFVFFFHREVAIKTLFTIVALALLPFLALSIFSHWLPALNALGFLVSGLLLVVGLSEHTKIRRESIFKLIAAIYVVYVGFWIYNTIHSRHERNAYIEMTSPEAIETLKKELEK
jgi:hypothetical protein